MSVIIDSDNNNVNITEEPINVTISTGGADVSAVWGGITGDLADQEDLQAVLDDKVPYTGATGDVNLGEYGIQLGNLEFDNTPTNIPTAAGSVYWSDIDGTLNMVLKGGQTISRIGETQHIRALNNTGAQIARGKVVYVVGAQGQRLTIALADADTEILSKDTIGFTSEAIADGAEGFVIVQGVINNISTTGMSDGATVYLSQTAGGYTTTPPVDPAHLVVLGFIVNGGSGGAGSIYVKVDNGYELGELHDVNTTGATNGQVLTYNGTTWVPATNGSGTVTSIATSAPITGGTITTSGTIGITQAGAAADGYLSATDWNTFNNKQAALSLTTTGTSGAATFVGATLNIPQYQAALTNPVTGTGASGQVSYWSGTGTQTGSSAFTFGTSPRVTIQGSGATGSTTALLVQNSTPTNLLTILDNGRISQTLEGSANSTAFGTAALNVATGANNVAFGFNAGLSNSTGASNSFFGRSAGQGNTSASNNSFFGRSAGITNSTGANNSFFGANSGFANTNGSNNSFFGANAGYYITGGVTTNTISNNSIFIGHDTRAAADNETNQIVIGYQETGLGSNTTIIGNTSTVTTALRGNLLLGTTTTTGARATVRGSGTTSSTTALLVQNGTPATLLQVLDNGRINQALIENTSNTAFGTNALSIASGGNNTAFGRNALQNVTTSINCSAFGRDAAIINTAGDTTAIGALALSLNISGFGNTAIGASALANTTNSGNVGVGRTSGSNNTTGANNTFIGYQAGRYITGGATSLTIANNSIFLGYDTRANADNETNQIVIGYQTTGLGSNTTNIGNTSTTQTNLYGNLTLGTTTSGGRLTVRGSGTTSSTTALLVQNSTPSTLFEVLDSGIVRISALLRMRSISGTFDLRSGVSSGSINDFEFGNDQIGANRNHTSGTSTTLFTSMGYAPTSGTGGFIGFQYNGTINQTGGANGITRGLYVNPTLTAAADWRGIESVAASNANHTLLKLRNATVDVFTVKADSKIGFFNATPVAQPTTGIAEATFVENSGGTAVNVDSTFAGYTLQQIAQALKDLGILA